MSVLVATDLDRTLIYSPRAAGDAGPATSCRVEGPTPSSSMTAAAAAALATLDARATWLPATTRTVEQFRRLALPRARDDRTRFAVCAHGGVLLVDGAPDTAWSARVRRTVAASAGIEDLAAALGARVERLASGPVRRADGLFLSVVVPRAHRPSGWVEELAEFCAARGWRVSAPGDKVHVLPVGLTKTAAVEEVLRRVGGERLLAAGDSPLDADLLLRADAGIRPAHGELHEAGWSAGHVAVTAATGIRAGEEIARWLLARTAAGG